MVMTCIASWLVPTPNIQMPAATVNDRVQMVLLTMDDKPVISAWINEEGRFSVCSVCSAPSVSIYAEAPDNPAENDLTYYIRRVPSAGDDVVFAALFRMGTERDELTLDEAVTDGGKVSIRFTLNGKTYRREYTVGEN